MIVLELVPIAFRNENLHDPFAVQLLSPQWNSIDANFVHVIELDCFFSGFQHFLEVHVAQVHCRTPGYRKLLLRNAEVPHSSQIFRDFGSYVAFRNYNRFCLRQVNLNAFELALRKVVFCA